MAIDVHLKRLLPSGSTHDWYIYHASPVRGTSTSAASSTGTVVSTATTSTGKKLLGFVATGDADARFRLAVVSGGSTSYLAAARISQTQQTVVVPIAEGADVGRALPSGASVRVYVLNLTTGTATYEAAILLGA